MKDPVAIFLASSTQWLHASAGMAGVIRTGLNYATLPVTASMIGADMTPSVFDDIRTLELAALTAWNRKNG